MISIDSTLRRGAAGPASTLAAAFLIACASARASASVIVVAASGGGQFTQIQDAVTAALDGDVILVKPGAYTGFTVTNKALDIVADAGGDVLVGGRVLVNQLEVTRTATLTGLHVNGTPNQPALHLSSDHGAVRVQNCTIRAFDRGCGEFSHGDPALDVDVCSDVVLARCTLEGGDGGDIPSAMGYGGSGGDATTPVQSRIAFYDCTLRGGAGGGVDPAACGATIGYGYGGGSGSRFLGCPIVFGSRCTFVGGAGSFGGSPSLSGQAGDGIQILGAAPYGDSHAWWLESTFQPGAPACTGCAPGASAVVAPSTTTSTTLTGAGRQLTTRALAREGELVRMRFSGSPGDRVELFLADQARFEFSPAWRGVLCVQARKTTAILQVGTIGASGVLDFGWPASEIGAGVDARRVFLQPMFVDASGQATLGTPHTLVLLDSSF